MQIEEGVCAQILLKEWGINIGCSNVLGVVYASLSTTHLVWVAAISDCLPAQAAWSLGRTIFSGLKCVH